MRGAYQVLEKRHSSLGTMAQMRLESKNNGKAGAGCYTPMRTRLFRTPKWSRRFVCAALRPGRRGRKKEESWMNEKVLLMMMAMMVEMVMEMVMKQTSHQPRTL